MILLHLKIIVQNVSQTSATNANSLSIIVVDSVKWA